MAIVFAPQKDSLTEVIKRFNVHYVNRWHSRSLLRTAAMNSKKMSFKFMVLSAAYVLILLGQSAHAQQTTIELWPDGAPGALGSEDKDRPKLLIFPVAKEQSSG